MFENAGLRLGNLNSDNFSHGKNSKGNNNSDNKEIIKKKDKQLTEQISDDVLEGNNLKNNDLLNIDGELKGETPIDVTVIPNAIEIFN